MDIPQYRFDKDAIQRLSTFRISKFFEIHEPTTQQDCDQKAADIAGGSSIRPTIVQGVTSYTVLAGTDSQKTVQFRAPEDALDVNLMQYAQQTYGKRFVPGCESFGMLDQLQVYMMDRVSGVAFGVAQPQLYNPGSYPLLVRTVEDFATYVNAHVKLCTDTDKKTRFFASAWHNRPASMPLPDAISMQLAYSELLTQLAQGLPVRFRPKLDEIIEQLPLLFMPDYPLVLNHADLLEMNIHVDPEAGGITGIVDWTDARVSPFGTSLWGLENILGVMTSTRWHFHPNHRGLRQIFWNAFYAVVGHLSDTQRQAIEVGRVIGTFRAYGFLQGVPVKEGSPNLICLEAFTLGLDEDSSKDKNCEIEVQSTPV
jgi:hypothetical protein